MTTEEHIVALIAQANPADESAPHSAPERAEAERILRRVLEDAPGQGSRLRGRPGIGVLVPVASLLVVLVVAAVILRTGAPTTTTGSTTSGGLSITLDALPSPQVPRITAGAMSREVALIRRRLASLGPRFTARQVGATRIVVTGPKVSAAERTRVVRLTAQSAQLLFYDWEANVLTPNGRTAASQLLSQDGPAVSVSEGGSEGAGFPGAGSMSLYDAVTLAVKQPPRRDSRLLFRLGPEYYMFGAPGSSACAAAARWWGVSRPVSGTVSGTHCLLAGPLQLGPVSPQRATDALAAQLPPGVSASQGQLLAIPQGTAVVQAEQVHSEAPVPVVSPAARFFVLRDDVALTGNDITHPKASTDQSGSPDVTFGFNGKGQSAFQRVTRTIAHRGANVSPDGQTLDQHFAVALDNQLVTVPQIDFHTYPDGIIGGGGADVTGGLTAQSARDLATELRYGALPLFLRVVP